MPRMGHVDWNFYFCQRIRISIRHAPHGACGLKSYFFPYLYLDYMSCPAWGMWIEINRDGSTIVYTSLSCPAWGMWIEICFFFKYCVDDKSHAPHGACGLKFTEAMNRINWNKVMPRMGHVDWNKQQQMKRKQRLTSCPAWGMWIEITPFCRNAIRSLSCPAWGMWIEIPPILSTIFFCSVMPRMGHVDWNSPRATLPFLSKCHAPHGACGLKFFHVYQFFCRGCHAPHGACGLKSLSKEQIDVLKKGHAPHGACGLKYKYVLPVFLSLTSCPAWGMWIEIVNQFR